MLVSWGASTLSSQLVRKHPRRAAVYGITMTSAALFGLAFASAVAVLPFFLVYGAGLGIAMTAISISRSREVEDAARSREMNRLNVLWAAGACLTPALALRSLHTVRVATTFAVIGCLFAATACSMAVVHYRSAVTAAAPLATALNRRVPFNYCLFAFLAVGTESCVGGWLTTYVRRTGHVAGVAALANTLFWVGLLLSRSAHAHRAMHWLRAQAGLGMHLLITAAASVLLLASVSTTGLLTASALVGLGLGPLYPTLLAVTLPRFRSNLIFLSAGIGSASLPWLVGVVSSASGSLHTGLWIVCAAVAALLVTATSVRHSLNH